jgi:hypothetical protein
MSASPIVPIFDPQGTLRDVPQEQMVNAVKSGGMPAVRFQAPDGKTRYVPANQIQDAVKAGGKILPIEQQDVQHPGFWSTLIDDAKGLGKSLLNAGPEMGSGDQIHQEAEYQQKLINEGRSLPYRALMSLTPNGMRESAESGDVGGVVGHTVVPAAAVASPLAAEGASRIAGSAAKAAGNASRQVAESGLRTVSDVVSPDVTGIISPRLAHAQRLAGKIADAIAKKPVYPGAPQPETPETGLLQASSLARGPQAVVDPAKGLAQIPVRYSPPASATVTIPPKFKPSVIEQQLKQSLGAQDLKPGVPLKDQLSGANAQPKPKLPEGFTPVDSTALKGFKYDPQTREFETITQGGQRYIHGDVSPEDAQAFMDADSKGKAWQQIRDNPLVAKVINGKRVAIKPTSPSAASPDDLTQILQESLQQALSKKSQ